MSADAVTIEMPGQSLSECLRRSLAGVALMVGFAAAIVACVWLAYMWLETTSGMRNVALATGIAAGVGATICLAGGMRLLDEVLRHPAGAPKHVRWMVYGIKRVLMAGELAAIGVAALAAMTLIFGFGIPGI